MKTRINISLAVLCSLVFLLLSTSLVYSQQIKKNSAGLQALESRLITKWSLMQNDTYRILKNTNSGPMGILNADRDIEIIGVFPSGKPIFYGIDNINAAASLNTDNVWPDGGAGYNYSGSTLPTTALGVWDGGGVLTTHQEYGGRVTQMDNPSSTHYHSTHVAGTMIAGGVQPSAKGMSYAADLSAYDWNSDEAEMASAANNDLLVSNHSYGTITGWYYSGSDWYWYGEPTISQTEDYGFGYYSSSAEDWDEIAYDAPYYTICKSAGNDRNDYGPDAGGGHYVWQNGNWEWSTTTRDPDGGDDGYDCVSYNGTAKNIITVGAVDDVLNYTDPTDVVMSSFSGWGPTDDGRIKPDLVANGVSLYSTMDDANNSYDYLSGTSMASPNLSGSIGLVIEAFMDVNNNDVPLAATVKSLLIHTARECGPNDGPDYMYGWGLADINAAIDHIHDTATNATFIYEDQLNNVNEDQFNFQSYGIEPVCVTIAYTDIPGSHPTTNVLNNTTPMLVNDLDITLERMSDNEIFYPYILDPANPDNAATNGDNDLDNVEKIYLATPESGQYRIHVNYEGTLSGGTQDYSLIISGLAPADDPTPPPSDLVAGHMGEGVVQLSWMAPPDQTTGFFEGFEDGQANYFVSSNNSEIAVANGLMNLNNPNLAPGIVYYKGQSFSNSLIEAEFHTSSSEEVYGLLINSNASAANRLSTYHFAISPKGYYALFKIQNGQPYTLIDWTSSQYLNTGSNAWNVISAADLDNQLNLIINGNTVATVNIEDINSGFAGLFTSGNEVNISQVAVITESDILNQAFNSTNYVNVNTQETTLAYMAQCLSLLTNNPRNASQGFVFNSSTNPYELISLRNELDEFLNYNIYRNGIMIGTSTTANYTDQLATFGTYSYTVTALYDEGESMHSSPSSVTWANPVGDILIWDPDMVPGSGAAIEGVLNDLGYSTVYTTVLTDYTLSDYFMVIVTAGMYEGANTYDFVDGGTEETMLIAHLESGGKLYLEGGDVFGYASTRPDNLIPYFNLSGIADGGNDMTSVEGDEGTFAEGIALDYNGVNSYIDHIEPDVNSERILFNPADGAGCGVLYDQGSYQTAGFSFEVGMLEDDGSDNSRTALLEDIVDWFINEPPGAFSLLSPDDGSSHVQSSEPLLFTWSTAIDPENDDITYTVWVADNELFNNPNLYTSNPPGSTNHGIVMSTLGDYWWKVSAVDEANNQVWSSETFTLTVVMNQDPTPFNLLSPADNTIITSTSCNFTWEQSIDPEGESVYYIFSIYELSIPIEEEIYTTSTNCTYIFPINGLQYNWTVTAYDDGGDGVRNANQLWSIMVSIPEPPGDFDLVAPVDDFVSEVGTVELSWNESIDININDEVSYSVHVAENPSFINEQIFAVGDQLTHTLSNLPDNSEYWWQVEAIDLAESSTFSNQAWHFSISIPESPSQFHLLTPEEEFASDTTFIEFTWETAIDPDPNADLTYNIYISQDPIDIANPPTAFAENIAGPAYSTSLDDEMAWYWTVKAMDNNTDGTWSDDVWAFIISQPDPPSPFDLLSPNNGDTLLFSGTWSQEFSWSESIDPDPESSVSYSAHFHLLNTNLGIDTTIVLEDLEDTSSEVDLITLANLEYWEEYLQLDWYVVAHSDDDEVQSSSQFTNHYEPNSNVPEQKFNGIPEEFSIASAYPNPFNPTVNIVIAVPERMGLKVQIYDVLGRHVTDLYESTAEAGYQRISWMAQGPSGVFFVRASADNGWSQIRKIIYMK